MKRLFDFLFASLILVILFFPFLLIFLMVLFTSKGPALYFSDRIGLNNKIFRMPKFRSMYTNTPEVATHLLNDPSIYITPVGKFLRKTSLDELPQLFSVLIGDMSFVGPRPALHNQHDLIVMRTEKGIDGLKPGITGWAQINGRDNVGNDEKVNLDEYYLTHQSLSLDIKILFLTVFKIFYDENVNH